MRGPRIELLPRLATVLACRIDDLFEEMDQPQGGNTYAPDTPMVETPPLDVDAATTGGIAHPRAPELLPPEELPVVVGADDDLPPGWKD